MSQKKSISTKSSKIQAKRSLRKPSLKTWVCPEGCKLHTSPCKHLEKLITPKNKDPQFESVNRYVGNNVEKNYYDSGAGYVIPPGIKNRSYEYRFRSKLEKAGLDLVKVDILVLRFVYDMSIRDIVEELGMFSGSMVVRLLDESLKSLKKRKDWNK